MVDLLLHHRAVQVVRAEALRDLRDLGRHHDPIRLDVADVVQHQARDRDHLKIQESGGRGNVLQRRVRGMKRQRNEGLKTAGMILQLAQLHQVIHAILFGFDVTIQHRAVGFQPELMRGPRDL